MNIQNRETRHILYAALSSCRRAAFSKVSSVPALFIRTFLGKFFCSITFNDVQIIHQNPIFVA